MWVQVRSMCGTKSTKIDGLSKLTKIEDLRLELMDFFRAPVDRQKLFFRGKEMVDGHSLFDYEVKQNDIIQILVRSAPLEAAPVVVQNEPEEVSPIFYVVWRTNINTFRNL